MFLWGFIPEYCICDLSDNGATKQPWGAAARVGAFLLVMVVKVSVTLALPAEHGFR